jgi:hypothetical protein
VFEFRFLLLVAAKIVLSLPYELLPEDLE